MIKNKILVRVIIIYMRSGKEHLSYPVELITVIIALYDCVSVDHKTSIRISSLIIV